MSKKNDDASRRPKQTDAGDAAIVPMKKWTDATIWKLVDSRCRQITDVVSAARIPFLLAITWTLLWAWALFTYELGYIRLLSERYSRWEANAIQKTGDYPSACKHLLRLSAPPTSDDQWKQCAQTIADSKVAAKSISRESSMISFPGGFGKVHISDLGILGNMALVLMLTWSFYAVRRENHSLKTMVRVLSSSDDGGQWPSKKFLLQGNGEFLSSEHLVYAYHTVSQRFLFLFSSRSKPLVTVTIALMSFPFMVALLHFWTDARDYYTYRDVMEGTIFIRVMVEVALVALVLALTVAIIRFSLDTAALLNGWALAVEKVWTDEWDETTSDTAPTVEISLTDQTARRSSA